MTGHTAESAKRAALFAVGPKVDREHRQGPGFCTCGAPLGDSIDWRWHLINSTIRATVEHITPTGELW